MSRHIWVISDTHFNHANIIDYCDRPFKNAHEMDMQMIERWNEVVRPEDKVYHLGDVYMNASRGYIEAILRRLNGHKRLILGNHDNGKDQILQKYFEKIEVWRHFKEFGLLLTHVPVHESTLNSKTPINIHGHIHQNKSPTENHRCVCVEHIGYRPINIEELRVKH